jgi:long-chain fatty acid transport protein
MQKQRCSLILTHALIAVLFSTTHVFAGSSGAFRIFAIDAEAMGKGGAFTAEADNPSAVFYNPAGTTQLKGAAHVSLGFSTVQPFVDRTNAGAETQMRRDTFLIPSLFYVNDFGLDKVVFGLGASSNWGLGTEWAKDSFSRYVATKSEVENMDSMLTVGYALNDQWSLAVGGILDSSKLNKEKQIYQGTGADGEGQVKGKDAGSLGFTLSTLYKLNEQHQLGLLYRSEINLTYKGEVTAFGLNDSGPQPYFTIFGGTQYSTKFMTDLTLPRSVALGYSYRPDDKWRFNFDLEWMDWSSVESEDLVFPDEPNATRLAILDALTKSDRDWNSVFSFGVGTEYAWNARTRIRGGYFYNPTPIPEANFDTAVPTADAHGINLGVGYSINDHATLDLAWTGMFYEDWSITNNVGTALGGDVDGEYENFVNVMVATVGKRF